MENPTQFDLNDSIQRWRANLEVSSAFHATDLNELEGHLRDSIATLQTKELSMEEAFWVATKRLGSQKTLCTEFGKVNGERIWLNKILWMLAGSLVVMLMTSLVSNLTSLAAIGINHLTIQAHVVALGSWIAYLLIFVSALVLLGYSGKNSNGWVWRVASWSKAHPVWMALAICLLVTLNIVVGHALTAFMMKSMSAMTFTLLTVWEGYCSRLFPMLLWPLLFACLLVRYRKTLANP